MTPDFISSTKIYIFGSIYVGAFIAHVLTLYAEDFRGLRPFLMRILPEKKQVFYHRIEFIVLPFIGALLAYTILPGKITNADSVDVQFSILTGLSWTSTVFAILQKKYNIKTP